MSTNTNMGRLFLENLVFIPPAKSGPGPSYGARAAHDWQQAESSRAKSEADSDSE